MAAPACPECGTTIEPDWDFCHRCGFDPDGLRPADWTPDVAVERPVATAGAPPRARTAPAPAGDDLPPPTLRPHDLLRPRDGLDGPRTPSAPFTGPLVVPDDDTEHKPLTLDELRRSTAPSAKAASTAGPAAPTTTPAGADPGGPDRFASPAERSRPPRPSDLVARAPAKPAAGERPPLFPAAPGTASAPSRPEPAGPEPARPEAPAAGPPAPASPPPAADRHDAPLPPLGPDPLAPPDPDPRPLLDRDPLPPLPERSLDRGLDTEEGTHPYLDLPYDAPSPLPGSEPEPEPAPSRLRRRKQADDRPNAATMAMAAGRIPSPQAPPPPAAASAPAPTASAGATAEPAAPAGVDTAVALTPPSSPADSSSLGPIVFSPSDAGPVLPTKPPKAKSSPLSVAAILMTIAIAVIVLWPTYRSLLESDAGPALPPPSAGPIGYAPAGADGSRAPVDPAKTASWATSAPPNGGFQVDMPGVVVVRTPDVNVTGGSAEAVVASASTGRGGYVVAAISPPSGVTWATPEQAAAAIVDGFNGPSGNDLQVGTATTVGGQPAVGVEGSVDGVPSKGAVVVAGNRAWLLVAGNAIDDDLERFLESFQLQP